MPLDARTERFITSIQYLIDNGVVKSKREVAKAINMAPSTLTDVSKGRNPASSVFIRRLSEVYGISWEYLIGDSDEMKIQIPAKDMHFRTLEFDTDNQATNLTISLRETIESQKEMIMVLKQTITELRNQLSIKDYLINQLQETTKHGG